MLWPYRSDNWREQGRPAQRAYAAVADAIGATTPVIMGVPAARIAEARRALPVAVTIVSIESDDAWMRDIGPTLVTNADGERRGVDWIFNAWGGLKGGLYSPWDRDEQVALQVCAHHGFARYAAPFVLEGGAIHTDGEGTLLVTEEVLLNVDRNPALTKAQIGHYLKDYLGADKIIWLPFGVYNDETSGHIDNMCCFARPGEVILTWTDDQSDPQYERSAAALAVLAAEVDARGRPFVVYRLQQPGPLVITPHEAAGITATGGMSRKAGQRLAGSYVNFLISNGRIVMPMLDPDTDEGARQAIAAIFPDHMVIGIPAREILLGGGNIHCVTQQIPQS